MRAKARFIFISAISIATSGCTLGNWNSIYRQFSTGGGESQLIDVKQRALLQQPNGDRTMVCAEPSPDALAVYGASVAAEGENPGSFSGSFSGSTTEAGVPFGLRTQSIQLLRDAYYRACEAYMSGAIDKETYDTLVRRLNNQAIAYLAIEQITSAVSSNRAPIVVSPDLARLYKQADSLQETMTDLDKKIPAKQKEVNDETNAEKKAKLQKELDEMKGEKTKKEEELKVVNAKILQEAKPIALAAAGNAANTQASSDAVKAAQKIALRIISSDYSMQMCFARLRSETGKSNIDSYCIRVVNAYAKKIEARADWLESLSRFLGQQCVAPNLDSAMKEACRQAIETWKIADAA